MKYWNVPFSVCPTNSHNRKAESGGSDMGRFSEKLFQLHSVQILISIKFISADFFNFYLFRVAWSFFTIIIVFFSIKVAYWQQRILKREKTGKNVMFPAMLHVCIWGNWMACSKVSQLEVTKTIIYVKPVPWPPCHSACLIHWWCFKNIASIGPVLVFICPCVPLYKFRLNKKTDRIPEID